MREEAERHRYHLPSCGVLFVALAASLLLATFISGAGLRHVGRSPRAPARPDLDFNQADLDFNQADLDSLHAGVESGPAGFEVTPAELDVGRLASGEVRRLEASWRRTGRGPLAVHGVLPSCGCAVVEPLPPTLAEGATGVLRIHVTAPRQAGPFSARLDFVARTVGGVTVRRRLRLCGFVESEVGVRPARIDVGRVTAGRALERTLTLLATPAVRSRVTGRWVGLDGGFPDGSLPDGSVVVEPPPEEAGAVWSLRLTLRAPDRAGPFRGELRVQVGEAAPLVVPVTGEAVVASRSMTPNR